MLKLLFFAALAYLLYRLIRKARLMGGRRTDNAGPESVDEMVQDPNCLAYVPKRDAIRKKIDGETHFFCSQACAEEFRSKQG